MTKLCKTGDELWEKYLETRNKKDYEAYLSHIQNCTNCFKKERKIAEGVIIT